jgi:hypothetical protein
MPCLLSPNKELVLVKNSVARLVWFASTACVLVVAGCSSDDARAKPSRTKSNVEIGPTTYNIRTRSYERPWPFGPESH